MTLSHHFRRGNRKLRSPVKGTLTKVNWTMASAIPHRGITNGLKERLCSFFTHDDFANERVSTAFLFLDGFLYRQLVKEVASAFLNRV